MPHPTPLHLEGGILGGNCDFLQQTGLYQQKQAIMCIPSEIILLQTVRDSQRVILKGSETPLFAEGVDLLRPLTH